MTLGNRMLLYQYEVNEWIIKKLQVGDLGLSKVKHQTLVSGGVRGTLPWMAPELMNGSGSLVSDKVCYFFVSLSFCQRNFCFPNLSSAIPNSSFFQVDVFSFGIVMWELLTGDEPYADLHYGAILGNSSIYGTTFQRV